MFLITQTPPHPDPPPIAVKAGHDHASIVWSYSYSGKVGKYWVTCYVPVKGKRTCKVVR